MEKNTFYIGIIACFLSLTLTNMGSAQEPSTTSMALKTIQIADKSLPIVLEEQVKGGHHQTTDHPSITIEDAVLELGMLVTNSSSNQTYRYDGLDSKNSNAEIWTPVFLVTNWVSSKNYEKGEIVADEISGGKMLFQALITNEGKNPKDNITYWQALGPINHMSIIYPSTSYPTNPDEATPSFDTEHPEDQTIISVGQTVVIIVDDYTLPPAATKKGETYIIKNKRSNKGYYSTISSGVASVVRTVNTIDYYAKSQVMISAATNEKVEGKDFKFLYQTNDFMTLLSDGTKWIMINEGPTGSAYTYNGEVENSDYIDGIYWGDPKTNGSFRYVNYLEGDKTYHVLQNREGPLGASGTWDNAEVSNEDIN